MVSPSAHAGRRRHCGRRTAVARERKAVSKPELGTVDHAIDPLNNTTSYAYDVKGNLTGITPPSPLGAVAISPDSLSRVHSRTDGKNQTTTYTYDGLDRPTNIAYADSTNIGYGYDGDGNQTSMADSVAGTTSYSYDSRNRQTGKSGPSGNASYGYDAAGNLTSLGDASGTTAYGYNTLNELTSLSDPNNAGTTFGYDANHNRTSTTYPNGVTTTAGYDNSQRLSSLTTANSSATLAGYSYSYTNPSTGHDAMLPYTITENDAPGVGPYPTRQFTTSQSYDALNRLTDWKVAPTAGGTAIHHYQYQYDANSNRTQIMADADAVAPNPVPKTVLAYDPANELTSTTFYDGGGVQTGGASWCWDANGSLLGNSGCGGGGSSPALAALATPSAAPGPSGSHPPVNERNLRGSRRPTNSGVSPAIVGGAIISNGTVQLGVNPEGDLNVPGGTPSGGDSSDTIVGLRYVPTNNDALSQGCTCEGWGAADATTGVTGYADTAYDGGTPVNISVDSFTSTSSTATSVVDIKDGSGNPALRVTHDYHPSPVTPYLYEVTVTIQNLSSAEMNARYRRVMDWDAQPTEFDEYVTNHAGGAPVVLDSNDDGFTTANPLGSQTDGSPTCFATGDFTNNGPCDQGALFDFGLGSVPAGQSLAFDFYYGAAGNQSDALAALNAVGAGVYSLAKPSSDVTSGTPNTWAFGLKTTSGSASPLTATYNARNQTSSMTDACGNVVPFTYNGPGQGQRLSAGWAASGACVPGEYGATTYTWNGLGLGSKTDSTGTTYYTLDASGWLISERTPNGTNYYVPDGNGNVVMLTDASGNPVNLNDYSPTGGQLPDGYQSGANGDQNPRRAGGMFGTQYEAGTQHGYGASGYANTNTGNSNQVCSFTSLIHCPGVAMVGPLAVNVDAGIPCALNPTSCNDAEGASAGGEAGSESSPSYAIKPGSAGGETAGQAFSDSVKQAAYDENPEKVCVYCGRPASPSEVDHAIPRSQGGNASLDNAQVTCQWCNRSKGSGMFPKNPPPDYEGPWPPDSWTGNS